MADEIPVCDVLCEAMEYLSKLGSNLRTRSEALKEKKIKKDKLKNAHAVQKAANKVLLICQLSKKSLDNVESGVKKILTLVDASQTSTCDGGKTSNAEASSSKKIDYQYFEYKQQKLKIAKKVSIKHYLSAKVRARSMPISMQEKYPVFYDCKLYRSRKRKALRESFNRRERSDRQSPERINSHGKVDSSPRKAIELTSHELRSPEREAHSKEKNDNDGSDSKEDVDSLGKKGNNKHASTEGDKDKKTRCDPNKSLKDSKNSPDESNSDSVESDSSEVLTKDVNSNDADDKDRHRQADSSKKVTITQKKSKRISSSDSEQGTVSHSKKNNDKERLSPAKDSPRKNYIDKCDHSNKEKKIESDSDASCKTNKDHVKAKNQNSDKERRDSNCHSVDSDDPKKLTDDPESSGIDGKEDNMNSERNYDKYDSDDSVTTTNNYNDGKKESNIRASVDRSSESENSATNNSENQKKQTYAESKVTLKVDGEENTIELNKTENLDQSDRPTPLEKPEISKSDSKIEHRKESDRTLNDDKYVENKKTDKKDKDSVIVSTESEKIKVKSYKKIYDSSDSDTSKSALVKSRTKKERKKKEHINKKYKEKRRRSFCISSDSDVDKDVHEKEKAHKKLKHIKVIEDSDSGNEATKDSEVNMSKENVEDEDKEHKSEKSDEDIALEPQKPLIKLVNINKLLKPDLLKNEQSTKPSTDEQQNKESGGVKNSKVKKTIKCSAMKSMNNNDRVEQKLKKVRYEDEENFWEPKRKEVEAFVPKPVTINIVRCTKLSELLRQHSLKKVTQCGSVICELNDDTISLRESTKHSTNDVDASNEKTVQLSDISTVKRALLVDSDSEKSESPVVINLTNEADNDKKILSDESDSEENDDRGNNKDMLTADAKKKNKPADDFETGKNILLDESDSEKNEQNSKSQVNKNSKSKRNLKDYETVKNTLLDESDSEKKDGEENEDLKAVRKHKSAQSKDENDKSFSVINNKQDSNKDSQRTAKNKISKSKRRKRDDETHAKKSLLDNSDSEKNEQDIGEDLQGTTKKSVRKGSNEDKETENVKNNLLEDSDSEKNDNEDTNLKTTKNSKSKGNNEDDETDKVKNNLLTDSDTEKNNEQSSGKEFEENDKSDNLDESDSEKNDEQSGDEKELTATNNKFKESNQEDETDNVKKKLLDDSDSEKNDEQDIGEDLQGTTKKSVRNCSNEDKETENVKNNLLEDSDSEKNDNEDTNLKTTKNSKSKGNNEDDETDKVKNNLLTDSDTEKNNEQSSGKEFEENDKSDNLGESDSEKNDEQSGDEKELTATNNKFKESNQEDETDNVKKKLLDDSDSEKNDDQASNNIENSKQNESSQDEEDVSLNENLQESNVENTLDPQSTEKEKNNKNKTPDKEIVSTNEDPDKVKSSLLNDSSDDSVNTSNKRRRKRSGSTPQSKRKHMMESMHAKKMLLTYSSSSDTEDEKLKDVFKEIKESLLKEITSDDEKQSKQSHRRKLYTSSDSDEDILKKVKKRKIRSKISSEKAREMTKKNEELTNEDTEEQSNINQIDGTMDETSNSSKMGRSREKGSGSSSHNSDNQDDKEVDGLSNLNTLTKSRRHRDSPTNDKASTSSKKKSSKAAPLITGEGLLEVPLSSDDDSAAADDAMEEDLPPVALSGLNGGSIGHLAKDDLLEDSDSSSSVEKDKDESSNEKEDDEDAKRDNESDTEKNVKTKRRKAHAISSDSEAGSSRPKGSNRDARLSDFEDSEEEGSEPVKKSKRKKKGSDSDASGGSSNEGSKKKRRRIKQIDDSDASGSDSENEGKKHGRKNIRKVMGKNQLEEATKKAAREEKERIARIADRQKMYNNLEFDESGKPDEVILDKVVLDFDPETKEPLIELDRGLVKKLKPHQANGIKFMWDACFESVKRIKKDRGSGCILAHCMGLGKTLQVVSLTHTLLTHSELTSVNRVLVVCPLSTVLNWVNEFRMWLKFAERDFEVDVYELSRFKQNSERAFQLSQWFQHGGVCVLGYEMFRNLSADNPKKFKKKMLKTFQESLVDPGPDMVVCDEGHLLKNEKTSLSQSMNRVKTHRRIVLTGTPLQNNLKEYYCMVQFVKPNLLGKYNEYLNRFVNPITNGQYTDSTEHDIRVMKRRSHVLHKMLDGAVQRRDYGVLAPFLPPKHEYVLFITLTEVQIKLYQHYLDNYSRRPLPGKSSGFLFPDFQSLQRIWTHPLVLKYNSERYEIMQQKKRDKEEEDSEGSLADFIDDDSTPDETSEEESSDDSSDMSDDSRKKSKKKKSAKKNKKDSKISTRRGTRANPVEHPEEEDVKDISEVIEVKNENPTEWWIPMVTDDEVEDIRNSHKLVLLFEILRQCEAIGDKLLVFSQSLYSLDLIEHFLGKVDEATQEGRVDEKLGGHVGSWSPGIDYFRLDGSTSCENRSIWCKNFNREDNPRARLFLISTRAGGLGINLVAANRVVIFDVSWNPSHDVQSIFRVYRFGQKKPCYVYRFLAMGTMEEKIYERQVTKQAISKRVIDEQQIDRHYAENDLAELYKFEPRQPEPRPVPLVPKDRLFAEMLKEHENVIYKFHEHDSLLENKEEETLSEEERKAAWEDFENEKNRPPPVPFVNPWPMHNGMVPNLLAQQQQQLAYAALATMLRKDMPNLSDDQIRGMLPLIYGANPGMFGGYDYGLMQKLGDIYKYPQPGMMNPAAMMNSVMNPAGGAMGGGGTSGLQYEPPWARDQRDQQNMRLQQLLQQQNQMGAKYYAGGLGSRDPVAMALQQQRAREIMLGEHARQRGRPPLQPRAPPAAGPPGDVVNLADSD